jgi:hypothetical protein
VLLNLAVLSFKGSSRCRTSVAWRPSTCAAVPTVMKALARSQFQISPLTSLRLLFDAILPGRG